MVFKTAAKTRGPKPASPEDLFRTLKRSGDVPHLWSHQADVLRAYMKAVDKPNVAFELPTGAGKSLIALLVAEYRRLALGERVAYVCATKQLAHHLHEVAEKHYGIHTVVLTGKQNQYDPADFAAFKTGAKIAITQYSSIFNTNPKIDNANCILLDDAHSAENYMANHWSVSITRDGERAAFDAIVNLFHDVLPESLVFHMVEDDDNAHAGCGLVHPPAVAERSQQLREILSTHAENAKYRYAWSLLDERLKACLVLVSAREILIRPLCPPSLTHAPFRNAKQRIFISATLGNGGELERGTGVDGIERLPLPQGWERRSSGRRLILLPDMSLRPYETDAFISDVAKEPGRLLLLTTGGYRAAKLQDRWLGASQKNLLFASDVESDLSVFTEDANAALVLSNRYDGIDLPGDACRRMIVAGLPDATNLLETFLTERMGAGALLRERIRTRLTQAMGRCTRNDVDHAIVLVVGDDVMGFLSDGDVRECMHPELQAELAFGIDNSMEATSDSFKEMLETFQTDEWDEAEADILERREGMTKKNDPAATALRSSVSDELKYVYALWNGDWAFASESARKALTALSGGSELKPYQGLWYYLAAYAALQADPGAPEATALANDFYTRAVACAPGLAFFLRTAKPDALLKSEVDVVTETAALRAARRLAQLGYLGKKFDKAMEALKRDLAATEANAFQRGLDALGEFLGFEVMPGIANVSAAPDGVWHIDHDLIVGWEAKSDETPKDPISVSTVRQAAGHFDWIKQHMQLTSVDRVTVILTSPRSSLDVTAKPFVGGLRFGGVDWVRDVGGRVVQILGEVRRKYGTAGQTKMAEELAKAFRGAKLTPKQLAATPGPLAAVRTVP